MTAPPEPPEPPEPQRRILVAVDIERYSRRENLQQYRIQHDLRRALAEACDRLGLRRGDWLTQAGGDGELAVLPAGTSEPRVVARLATTLDALLRERNRDLAAELRLRLRVAVHVGLVHVDGANGFPGSAAVTVCRIVDAAPLKRALAAFPAAGAALIVSEQVYDDVVAQRYEDLRPEGYTRIRVELPDKDFAAVAWITVPGEPAADVARVLPDLLPEPAAPTSPVPSAPAAPARPGGGFSFGNLTTNGPAAFGENSRAVSGLPEVPR
ncbi:hypothetical protein ABT297_11220 [Dactylosporangium sp. NPDC000555]|uniref:hypothetical protein n=1 Tax=Dactylosporangium sp. NPDC000555 TaxID=3154260 RepID=UPI0033175089